MQPQIYRALYKQALESQHLQQQAACLAACAAEDPAFALGSLRGMAEVQRFGMVVMQLRRQDKQALGEVMAQLEGAGQDVAELRRLYKL